MVFLKRERINRTLLQSRVNRGVEVVAFLYDALGRIVSSDIEGMTEVKYNVAGYPSYIAQADGGYVHNTYTAEVARIASRRTDGASVVTPMEKPRYCWNTKDHLGSVRAVADADGNVFATYAYSPYGEDFANGKIKRGQVTRTNHRGKTVLTVGATSNIIDDYATTYYEKNNISRSHRW